MCPCAIDAWLAITENSIGPKAYRPQEVVRALNGTTIQVIHSDAEGRMALADTLALAARRKPRAMVDFATLTGACVYALTERMSGLLATDARLAARLLAAATPAASGCGSSRCPRTTTPTSTAPPPTSRSARWKARAITSSPRASCKRFVPDDIAWAHIDLSSATRRGGLAHVPTEITGFGARLRADACCWITGSTPDGSASPCASRTTGTCTCATALHCNAVLPHTAAQFARAIVMPNLKPPVTTTAQAGAYRDRILAARPAGSRFEPLMTLYLTDRTDPREISRAQRQRLRAWLQAAIRPAPPPTPMPASPTSATSTRCSRPWPQMGLPLLVHGEVTQPRRSTCSIARRASSTRCWRR